MIPGVMSDEQLKKLRETAEVKTERQPERKLFEPMPNRKPVVHSVESIDHALGKDRK